MFFDIRKPGFGQEAWSDSKAEKAGKASFFQKETGKLYISEMEIINVRILNRIEKGFKATLGKVARIPIHWG